MLTGTIEGGKLPLFMSTTEAARLGAWNARQKTHDLARKGEFDPASVVQLFRAEHEFGGVDHDVDAPLYNCHEFTLRQGLCLFGFMTNDPDQLEIRLINGLKMSLEEPCRDIDQERLARMIVNRIKSRFLSEMNCYDLKVISLGFCDALKDPRANPESISRLMRMLQVVTLDRKLTDKQKLKLRRDYFALKSSHYELLSQREHRLIRRISAFKVGKHSS